MQAVKPSSNILVAGATGAIGVPLVRLLVRRGRGHLQRCRGNEPPLDRQVRRALGWNEGLRT